MRTNHHASLELIMREDLQFIIHALYHGVSGAIVAGATAMSTLLVAVQRMPLDWEWLAMGAGMALQFVNSISSFLKDPK